MHGSFSVVLFSIAAYWSNSGYPDCDDRRRLPEEAQANRRDEVQTLSASFLAVCAEEENAVLESIRSGVEGVSDSCNALLRDHADVQCFELDQMDDSISVDQGHTVLADDRPHHFPWLSVLVGGALLGSIAYFFLRRQPETVSKNPSTLPSGELA